MKVTTLQSSKRNPKVKYLKLPIYLNGQDNLFPYEIDDAFSLSVTAKKCLELSVKHMVGSGFGIYNKVFINKKQNLLSFFRQVSREYKKYGGVFIHVSYLFNGRFEPDELSVLPFTDCRVGKMDDTKYSGKILAGNWEKYDKNKIITYNSYNSNQNVIKEQVRSVGGLEKYSGQVLFIKKVDEYIYSESDIEVVLNDCFAEYYSSLYTRNGMEKGRFGASVFLTEEIVEGNIDINDEFALKKQYEQMEQRSALVESLKSAQGVDNTSQTTLIEVQNKLGTDNISNLFQKIDIDSNINDKLFEYTDLKSELKIIKAFDIPPELIRNSNNLFANSGEAYKQMKNYLSELMIGESTYIINILNELLGIELNIESL